MGSFVLFVKSAIEISDVGLTYMFKVAWIIEVTFTDRTDVVLIEVVEVFSASRIPNHPITTVASLTHCSMLSRAVVLKQVIPG